LSAAVIREAIRRSQLDATVGAVIMGNVIQAGNRMNPARQAALHGGVAVSVPALTVNRVCGSGAQAILSAAQEILLGNAQVAIAGGMENMDRAPYLLNGGRWGYCMGDAQIQDSMLLDGLNDAFSGEHSGWHTEYLVTKIGLTREEQDRWAERSQQRFAAAQSAGKFEREIGHPIGATGAVLATRLLHSLTRDGVKRGIVTLCIGGGQGIALTFEIL
jgi:acetyl-CoA C-acetyltransferase